MEKIRREMGVTRARNFDETRMWECVDVYESRIATCLETPLSLFIAVLPIQREEERPNMPREFNEKKSFSYPGQKRAAGNKFRGFDTECQSGIE